MLMKMDRPNKSGGSDSNTTVKKPTLIQRIFKQKTGTSTRKSKNFHSDDALPWFTSFEKLLKDKSALTLFHEYLKSEFSDENVEFWIACEEYKSTKKAKLASMANSIYEEFILPDSPRWVNLDSKTCERIRLQLEDPNHNMFSDAQHRIEALMEKNAYQRFLTSTLLSSWASKNKVSLPQS